MILFDEPFEQLVGRTGVYGTLNNRKYRALVNKNSSELNRAQLVSLNRLRNPRFSEFGLLDLKNGFWCFYYEAGENLYDYLGGAPHSLDQTQTLILQMLQGFEFLHDQGFVHTEISPRGFILERHNGKMALKIDVYLCTEAAVADGSEARRSNVEGISHLLSTFFHDCLPERHGKYLFDAELAGLASILANPRSRFFTNLQNHPFFWTAERRQLFYQHVFEIADGYADNGSNVLIRGINQIRLADEVGNRFQNIPFGVCRDLDIEKHGERFTSSYWFLRCIRHFGVHVLFDPCEALYGWDTYKLYGSDPLRSFDIFLGFCTPSFFMNVFETASDYLTGTVEFERFLDLSFDVAMVPLVPLVHDVPYHRVPLSGSRMRKAEPSAASTGSRKRKAEPSAASSGSRKRKAGPGPSTLC